MTMINAIIIVSIIIAVAIGIVAGRKIRNNRENFFVAGRRWSWMIVGFALMAQAIDGNVVFGNVSLGFDSGFWSAAAMPVGLALSLFLLGRFFAPELNRMRLMTLGDFFRQRYGRTMEVIASLLMLLSFGILLAGNIAAVAILVTHFLSIHYATAVIVICIVILAYCIGGGIISDLYSDLWQMLLLVIGVLLLVAALAVRFDFSGMVGSVAWMSGMRLSPLFSIGDGGLINWATVIALGCGNILAIDFNSRIFAAGSPKAAAHGCYWGGFLTLLVGLPFAFLPVVMQFLHVVPVEGTPVFLTFILTVMPVPLSGVLIAGIIAASLSTIDGAMLSMGNIFVQNLLRVQDDVIHQPHVEAEKTFLYFSRLSLIPIACLAMIFALLLPSPGVLLTIAFDLMFASLLAPFIMAFYGKQPNTKAAVWAIGTGFCSRLLFGIFMPASFGVPNTILYIPNSLIPAQWDGIGTIVAPVIAFLTYWIVLSVTVPASTKGASVPEASQQSRWMMLLTKQNLLKNITVILATIVLTVWVVPYARAIGPDGLDAFFFLSIFPLGAMFAYFAFRYSDTNIHSTGHRMLADISTFIFLLIICFSISFAAVLSAIAMPPLKYPVIVLAVLLTAGCLIYDFWNLFCNLMKVEKEPG